MNIGSEIISPSKQINKKNPAKYNIAGKRTLGKNLKGGVVMILPRLRTKDLDYIKFTKRYNYKSIISEVKIKLRKQ